MDKRKLNGGARQNAGKKPINPEEKKIAITFMVKNKHAANFKQQVQPIAADFNSR